MAVGASEREREAHMGEESRWRDGSALLANLREAARPMPAPTTAAAAAVIEGRKRGEALGWRGGLGG